MPSHQNGFQSWLRAAAIASGFVAALAVSASANTLSLILTQDVFNVLPGGSFTIYGTFSQTSPDMLSIPAAAAGGFDAAQFDLGATDFDPAFLPLINSYSDALTLYSGPILDVTMLATATPGFSESPKITITTEDQTVPDLEFTSAPFTVNVVSGTVPESPSWVLMCAGLAISAWGLRSVRPAGKGSI